MIKVGIELGTFSLTSSIQKFPASKQTVNTNIKNTAVINNR